MNDQKTTYMTVCLIDGLWQVVVSSNKEERDAVLEKHKEAVPVRFNVSTIGGNSAHEVWEDAEKAAQAAGVRVTLMRPGKDLPNDAVMAYYACLPN
jgi:predicted nucleic acid-binding protein